MKRHPSERSETMQSRRTHPKRSRCVRGQRVQRRLGEFRPAGLLLGWRASMAEVFDEWPGEFCGQGASKCGLPGSGWAEEGNRSRHPKLEVIGQFAIEERIHNAAFNDGLLGPHAGNGCPFRGLEEFASPTVQNADVRRSQRFVLLQRTRLSVDRNPRFFSAVSPTWPGPTRAEIRRIP